MTMHVQYSMPKKMNPQVVRGKIMNVVKWINHEQLILINNYLWTWHHRSDVQVTNRYGYVGGDAYAEIYIEDPIFWYLELGTTVRHAAMSADFVPKTRPGFTQSGRGQGGVVAVSPNIKKPGIEARHVLLTINKILMPVFFKKMQQALGEALGAP